MISPIGNEITVQTVIFSTKEPLRTLAEKIAVGELCRIFRKRNLLPA